MASARGGAARLTAPPVTPLAGWLTPRASLRPTSLPRLQHVEGAAPGRSGASWSDQGTSPATHWPRLRFASATAPAIATRCSRTEPFRSHGAPMERSRTSRCGARLPRRVRASARPSCSIQAKPEVWSTQPGRYIVAAWAGPASPTESTRARRSTWSPSTASARCVRHQTRRSSPSVLTEAGIRRARSRAGAPERSRPRRRGRRHDRRARSTKADPAVGSVSYSGDWLGRRVVAPSASGLAVFRVGDRASGSSRPFLPRRRAMLPSLASRADRVTAWTSGPPRRVPGLRSHRGPPRVSFRSPRARHARLPAWRRPLYNPSRPQ